MHSDPNLFLAHVLPLAAFHLAYLIMADGYVHVHGHVDDDDDVYADFGDYYYRMSQNLPSRTRIPRSMIHRISEVYGKCNRLKFEFSIFLRVGVERRTFRRLPPGSFVVHYILIPSHPLLSSRPTSESKNAIG
jgi:hypothetical protein